MRKKIKNKKKLIKAKQAIYFSLMREKGPKKDPESGFKEIL